MKKYFLLLLPLLFSCSSTANNLSFDKNEYLLQNGDSICVKQNISNVKYKLIGDVPFGVSLSEKGKINFDESIPNYTQVLAIAFNDTLISNEVVLTLYYDYLSSTIEFTNQIDYIINGETVKAVDSNDYGIVYSLKENIKGISIDKSSGKVSYTSVVEDNTPFVVQAKSGKNNIAEHTFYTVTKDTIKAENKVQINKMNTDKDSSYYLDFSSYRDIENEDIVSLCASNNKVIENGNYDYNIAEKKLTLKASYINSLKAGEHIFKIITKRNAVEIQLNLATKFIDSAEDLASISDLSGYYIQTSDIDLKDYLSNKSEGWTPIGLYHDVLDQTQATKDAFKGTYDGNGHVITNLTAKRKDECSFNFGLFGYTTSSSVIRNLGVEGSVDVSSYSGGLVGSNSGLIENCYANVLIYAYSGGDSYRYVGGLVGNNFGTIKSSYAYGNIKCDKQIGALIGNNEGEVENCFSKSFQGVNSLIGNGSIGSSNILFASMQEMKDYDYSSMLSSKYWKLEKGSLPSLVPNQY